MGIPGEFPGKNKIHCPYEGCNIIVEDDKFLRHKETCEYFPTNCFYCGSNYEKFRQAAHEETCLREINKKCCDLEKQKNAELLAMRTEMENRISQLAEKYDNLKGQNILEIQNLQMEKECVISQMEDLKEQRKAELLAMRREMYTRRNTLVETCLREINKKCCDLEEQKNAELLAMRTEMENRISQLSEQYDNLKNKNSIKIENIQMEKECVVSAMPDERERYGSSTIENNKKRDIPKNQIQEVITIFNEKEIKIPPNIRKILKFGIQQELERNPNTSALLIACENLFIIWTHFCENRIDVLPMMEARANLILNFCELAKCNPENGDLEEIKNFLLRNPNIKIVPVDESNNISILDIDEYHEKMVETFSDQSKFEKLDSDPDVSEFHALVESLKKYVWKKTYGELKQSHRIKNVYGIIQRGEFLERFLRDGRNSKKMKNIIIFRFSVMEHVCSPKVAWMFIGLLGLTLANVEKIGHAVYE